MRKLAFIFGAIVVASGPALAKAKHHHVPAPAATSADYAMASGHQPGQCWIPESSGGLPQTMGYWGDCKTANARPGK
jgi:hypothetical protein